MPSSGLSRYRQKRSAGSTPEPFGSRRVVGGSIFVVHHHAARREHYDLRLEVDGTLWSWAIPKGPVADPSIKRLAVHTEPHPIDYAYFEDTIPEGNYGAGAMIIWDRGRWVPKGDPNDGLAAGKLLFELKGFKLHGTWTLVRTSQDWLLIKERDQWVAEDSDYPADSVLSGLTVQELKTGHRKPQSMAAAVRRQGAVRPGVEIDDVEPMLCEKGEPFDDPDWLFEVKYDGYRLLVARDEERVILKTRRGRDVRCNFPELEEAVRALPYPRFLIDGEVVVTDSSGLPSFSRLQQRGQLQRAADIARAAVALPAQFQAFDFLGFGGLDLRDLELSKRKRLLRRLLPSVGYLRYVDHLEADGRALFERAVALGIEGLVAKRKSSPYRSVRSPDWIKIPALHSDDFAVVGYTPAKSGAGEFGALLLAARKGETWVPVGRAGSGLGEADRARLAADFEALERDQPAVPADGAPRGTRWLEPRLVVEVRFKEFTPAGQLRQPVLVRVRPDKAAASCVTGPWSNDEIEPAVVTESVQRDKVIFSNRDKLFWPESGLTKGDLIDYYREISDWMLPYLADRPVVLTRYPDGIEGKSFYQHRAPEFLPDWIRREPIWSDSDQEEREYIIVDDEDTLLYIANLGTIPIHVWNASASDLPHVDWCVLDLDPKEAPFRDVVKVARELHTICWEAGLASFLKTSGSTGLHVMLPVARRLTHDQSKDFGELLARVCVARIPAIATIQRHVELREGRVYIDYMQNGYGKTIAAPFCVRPVPGASVSMPLRWRELGSRAKPERFHIRNAGARMRALGEDPNAGLLDSDFDPGSALGRLQELFAASVGSD